MGNYEATNCFTDTKYVISVVFIGLNSPCGPVSQSVGITIPS